jgi:hypothetical protein
MKTVKTIKFAVPVNRVLRNGSDLTFFDLSLPEANYIKVEYDGTDFLITNNETKETTYVAKTNVSQWKFDGSTHAKAEGSSKGAVKKASKEAES